MDHKDMKDRCCVCDKLFNNKSNANRHLKMVHGVKELKKNSEKHQGVRCGTCNRTFFDKSTLNSHLKNVHKVNISKSVSSNNINKFVNKCLECSLSFECRTTLVKHLVTIHNFKNEILEEDFATLEEFHMWLRNIEEENKIEYIRKIGKNVGQTYTRFYYECSRSGKMQSIFNRKRLPKSQGSKKIDLMCTSHIVVRLNNTTNAVRIKYLKTHYEHDMQLQHVRIPENARKNIAGKLLLGVSVPKIIDSIRDSMADNILHRVDLTTKKDIYNIKRSFKIDVVDGVRHSDDATSVALWVKECTGDNNNPVQFYKPQGVDDYKYQLKLSDFCLILMNNVQMEYMKKFSHKFVCIDGTHGTNPYDFELNTLMVSDEFGEGMPVAYMVSNRNDSKICEVFFTVIKNAVGLIDTKTFMSDITETYYNAWKYVMGIVPNRIFCSWHVDRAWKSNLMKIVSCNHETTLEKRKDIYKILKVIQTTLDEANFLKFYDEFLTQLQCDPETVGFYEYFIKNYGSNHLSWAYCYRKELLINTNMYLESMHRVIKYEYLEGKKVKRMDKSLHNLMRFTRDKQVERIIKLTKGKCTDRLNTINASHRTALKSNFDLKNNGENDSDQKTWCIFDSITKKNYVIAERTSGKCCALICQCCNICYHSYSCTCIDYFIKSNICKHIHFYCIHKIKNCETVNSIDSIMQTNSSICLQEEIDSCLQGLNKVPKENKILQDQLVNAALRLVTLARKPATNEVLATAIRQVNAANSLLEIGDLSSMQQFEMPDTAKLEPSNKKITKQIPFFSTKQKRSSKKIAQNLTVPSNAEKSTLELLLSKDLPEISTRAFNDHNYSGQPKVN